VKGTKKQVSNMKNNSQYSVNPEKIDQICLSDYINSKSFCVALSLQNFKAFHTQKLKLCEIYWTWTGV